MYYLIRQFFTQYYIIILYYINKEKICAYLYSYFNYVKLFIANCNLLILYLVIIEFI
jgi:hypothetical protein